MNAVAPNLFCTLTGRAPCCQCACFLPNFHGLLWSSLRLSADTPNSELEAWVDQGFFVRPSLTSVQCLRRCTSLPDLNIYSGRSQWTHLSEYFWLHQITKRLLWPVQSRWLFLRHRTAMVGFETQPLRDCDTPFFPVKNAFWIYNYSIFIFNIIILLY